MYKRQPTENDCPLPAYRCCCCAYVSPCRYEVAPPGKTGLYFALANVPLFLPKVLAGFMSGYLLELYCSADDCSDPRPLWGWIMAACLPFPCALYMFKGWINLIPRALPMAQTV